MFEKATRQKLRFNYKGILTVEDLWDLNLEQLSDLHAQISAKQKPATVTTLLNSEKKTKEQEQDSLRLEIIAHVFKVKETEASERKEKVLNQEKKKRIKELIDKKKNEELEGKSIEELEKIANEL